MCVNLVKFGHLNYCEVLIAELVNNATNRRSITVAGKLSANGDCKGTSYNDQGQEYDSVVVTAKLEINIGEFNAVADKGKNKLNLPTVTACVYTQGRCLDQDDNTMFWTPEPPSRCNFENYFVLFKDIGVKVTSKTSPTIYFDNSTDEVQFVLAAEKEESLYGYRLIRTEHPKFFILEASATTNFQGTRVLAVQNILSTAYFNTKIS